MRRMAASRYREISVLSRLELLGTWILGHLETLFANNSCFLAWSTMVTLHINISEEARERYTYPNISRPFYFWLLGPIRPFLLN